MQLLKALDELLKNKNLPKIKLHICGTGYQGKDIRHFISRSKRLDKAVELHGFVSEQEKIEYLNKADFAVFPSLGGESFGIVLIEAMAAGAGVVLAGDNPGYRSVMQDIPECLFDPHDPMVLKEMLQSLITDRPRVDSLHDKQQALVLKFDVNTVGRKLLSEHYI